MISGQRVGGTWKTTSCFRGRLPRNRPHPSVCRVFRDLDLVQRGCEDRETGSEPPRTAISRACEVPVPLSSQPQRLGLPADWEDPAVGHFLRDLSRYVERMDMQHWMIVLVVAIVLGVCCLRGFGSRSQY